MITKTFITRTLSDILPGFAEFDEAVISKLNFELNEAEKDYLFLLIFAKYADSHVRYTNESLFVLNLRKEIMVLYPMVLAMLRDQKKLREGTDADFMRGGKVVVNAAAHNTAEISNDTTEGIEQLDSQTISNTERAKIDVLYQRMDMYKSNMENRFLEKLAALFVQIIYPQRDLLYITAPQNALEADE